MGDTIRIVASSSPFNKEAFLAGTHLLKSWGFKVKYQKDIFAKTPYLAGSDKRRASELAAALADDSTKAILFARGGYGATRLLPLLDKMTIQARPKIILGYSDITALLFYIQKRFGWITFYGPVVAKDLSQHTHQRTLRSFKNCLTKKAPYPKAIQSKHFITVKKGKATAPLVGGCLTLLATQIGTRYEPNTAGKILFLEDVNEKPYEVDRMLTHLKQAGKFKDCRGLIFSIPGPNPMEHYIETIQDIFKDTKIPILFGLPAGHTKIKLTLPLGATVSLDSTKKSLTFMESSLS